ncbi:MAG: paraquat-inducible protein A [Candidatus Omnitrophica bacterium]|nr:paraquat-inducible protein A [Candidatus Omnitrophota bacterium]
MRLANTRQHPEVLPLLLAALTCLIFGLRLPTLTMKELVFKEKTFSILSGIQNLYEKEYYFLALIIFVFSVVFPMVKLAALGAIWLGDLSYKRQTQIIAWLERLGKWSMLDVFVVAVTIIITRMSRLLEARPEIGIYVFGTAVILSMLATWRIEHILKLPQPTSLGT